MSTCTLHFISFIHRVTAIPMNLPTHTLTICILLVDVQTCQHTMWNRTEHKLSIVQSHAMEYSCRLSNKHAHTHRTEHATNDFVCFLLLLLLLYGFNHFLLVVCFSWITHSNRKTLCNHWFSKSWVGLRLNEWKINLDQIALCVAVCACMCV